MAALKDIAREAGVSVATVSSILNQGRAHFYTAQTRQRVLEVSEKFGYRADRSAQAMRSRKTRVVGFAALNRMENGQLQNQNVYPFIVGLNSQLAPAGYHVAFVECADLGDAAQPSRPWSLRENFLDALVVHYGMSDRAVRFAQDMGVPLIWWDSGVFEPYGCIYRDEIEVTRQVVGRLIKQGHRRIAFMVGESEWQIYCAGGALHYSYAQRFETYRQVMRDHGLRDVPLIGYTPAKLAPQLAEHRLTAVVMQGAGMGAIPGALQTLGWRIPDDLTMVTLDREARLPAHVRISGMLYDRYAAGEQAAHMALSLLEHGKTSVPSVRFVGEFDAGDTMAPPDRP